MTVTDLQTRRRVTIGGSEIGAACGLDQFTSRIMLWAEKTGRYTREHSEAMQWGNLLEPVILGHLESTGYDVLPAPADGFFDPERPWLVGHPDAFTVLADERAVLEVKTGGLWLKTALASDVRAPSAHVAQVQWYMHLTGDTQALLAYLVAGQRYEERIVERDDAVIAAMMERAQTFLDLVTRDEPPAPDGSDSAGDALRAIFPKSNETSIRFDRATWNMRNEYAALLEQEREIKAQAKEKRQLLQAAMGEAAEAYSPHDVLACKWSDVTSRRFDQTAFRSDHPALFERYKLPTTSRRFSLT